MNKLSAFEKMRLQRDKRQLCYQRAVLREMEEDRARWRKEDLDRDLAEIDRKGRENIDRIIYDVGMAAWGADLQWCLLGPTPLRVPEPPIYGGEPYKMMKLQEAQG